MNDDLRYGSQTAAAAQIADRTGFLKIRYKHPDGDGRADHGAGRGQRGVVA